MASSEEVIHLKCSICLEVYRSPRSLPCLHTFCEACLQSYIAKAEESGALKKNKLPCPICRKPIVPPAENAPPSTWAKLFHQSQGLFPYLERQTLKVVERTCGPCAVDELSNPASKFCHDCREYLCKNCLQYHRRFRTFATHRVVTKTGEHYGNTGMITNVCSIHGGAELKYYCKDQQMVCCTQCAFEKHRRCSDIVELKDEASVEDVLSVSNILEGFSNIEKSLKNLIEIAEENIEAMSKQKKEIPSQVQIIRKQMNVLLDKLEKDVTAKCKEMCKIKTQAQTENVTESQRLLSAVQTSRSLLTTVNDHGTLAEKLYLKKRCIAQGIQYHRLLLKEQGKAMTFSFGTKTDRVLTNMLQSKSPLIEVTLDYRTVENALLRAFFTPLKAPRVQYLETVEIKVGSKAVISNGAVCMADDRVALVDSATSQVITVNRHFPYLEKTLQVDKWPYKLAMVDEKSLLLSYQDQRYLQYLSLEKGLMKGKQINTDKRYNNVCPIDETRYACASSQDYGFAIINTKGKTIQEISRDSTGRSLGNIQHMALTKDKECILQSAGSDLYCFSLEGDHYFRYQHPELRSAAGVGVDRNGYIYVCGKESNNIHQLTPEGRLVNIIKLDTLKKPSNICFFRNGRDFFVTSDYYDTDAYRNQVDDRHKIHMFTLETTTCQ